jgi:excisionase family DNA binding protein
MQAEQETLLTVREVAEILKVPTSWVYDHARPQCPNRLPCIKVGKYLRFIAADIADYLQKNREVSAHYRNNLMVSDV